MQCRSYQVIGQYLQRVAETLIPERLDKRAHSQPVGTPTFLVIDELPSIIREVKKAPEWMRIILEEGRKVGVYLISAAHNFLVKTIAPDDGGGSIRDCYRTATAYYAGGDPTTAKGRLGLAPAALPEAELGKGRVMLRNTTCCKKAQLVLVPYVDNAALYRLLGPSTYQPPKDEQQAGQGEQAPAGNAPASAAGSPITVTQWGGMTIETILSLSQAGVIDDQGMYRLMELLPVYQSAEQEEQMYPASQPDIAPAVPAERKPKLRVLPPPEHAKPQEEKSKNTLAERKASRLQRLRSAQPVPSQPRLSPELQEALDAYEPGMSYRELGAKIGKNKDTAGARIEALRKLGLIQ